MSIDFNDNFNILSGKPISAKYYALDGSPYASVSAANLEITITYRFEGLTVNISNVEYWYKDGVSDGDLVVKDKNDIYTVENGLSLSTGNTITLGGVLNKNTEITGNYDFYLGTEASKLDKIELNFGGGGLWTNDNTGAGQFFQDKSGGGIFFNLGKNIGDSSGGLYIRDGRSNNNRAGGIGFTSYDSASSNYVSYNQTYNSIGLYNSFIGEFEIDNNNGARFEDNRSSGNKIGITYKLDYSNDFIDRSLIDKGYLLKHKEYQTVTGTTPTVDILNGQNIKTTLLGNTTLTLSNLADGHEGNIIVTQDATGSRTLTISPTPKVIDGGGGVITLTGTANSIDILSYTYDGSNLFITYGKNYS